MGSMTAIPELDLVDQAGAVAPALAKLAAEGRRLGRLPDAAVDLLAEAGLFRVLTPRSRGGHQASLHTFAGVLRELARVDGSAAWVTGIYNGNLYVLTTFSDAANDEVHAGENPRLAQSFNLNGQAVPVRGGYRLSGTWGFCSGQHHAQWAIFLSLIVGEGEAPEPAMFLVSKGECAVLDDWHVCGLAATGSHSLTVEDVFVPAHRVARPFSRQQPASADQADPYFRIPAIPFFLAGSVGAPLGLAAEALRLWKARIHRRGITHTSYACAAHAPDTHFRLAEAEMKLDEARFHAERAVETACELTRGPLGVTERVRIRGDVAWTVDLCREVVDLVQRASGSSAIREHEPLPHIVHDIEALSVHGFLVRATNAEAYGRVLAGLDPGTDLY